MGFRWPRLTGRRGEGVKREGITGKSAGSRVESGWGGGRGRSEMTSFCSKVGGGGGDCGRI